METTIRDAVYAEATRLDIHELVRILNGNVGPTIVQTIAGVQDRTMPSRWAKPEGPEPRAEAQKRLRLGYRVWRTIERSEGRNVALAWLVGANPRLGEEVPLAYVCDLRTKEVMGAAEAFVNDVYAA